MSTDIHQAYSQMWDVHNGSIILSCLPSGKYSKRIDRAVTSPDRPSIESKYQNRFDDPSYYYGGGGSTDGGFYGEDVLGV